MARCGGCGRSTRFPKGDVAQTAAVAMALAAAIAPRSADAIAAGFKQGRKVAARIQATLNALARMGHLATADGVRFALRRVA